jgi:hypothetical protein
MEDEMARPEITGRRIEAKQPAGRKKKARRKRVRKPLPPRREGDDYTIAEWCAKRRISESFFHKLKSLGLGPRVTHTGRRVTISEAADAEWQVEREREAASAA